MKQLTCGIFHSFAGHWQLIAEELGLKTAWYYENFKKERQILEHNRPDVYIIENSDQIKKEVDIIMGSPPCVGMSQANPKACCEHPANEEMRIFAQKVRELKPEYFFMEMVPTLLQDRFKPIYQELMDNFNRNHKTVVKTFDFKDYGTPQARERVLIYGCRSKYLLFPKPTGTSTIRDALDGLKNYSKEEAISLNIAVEMKPHWKGPYSMFVNNPEYFNLEWDGVSKVITALGSGYLRHPDGHRRITYREAARFMEFPDDYDFSIHALSQIFRDIGWGVPILGMARILRKLLDFNGKNDGSYERLYIKKSMEEFF